MVPAPASATLSAAVASLFRRIRLLACAMRWQDAGNQSVLGGITSCVLTAECCQMLTGVVSLPACCFHGWSADPQQLGEQFVGAPEVAGLHLTDTEVQQNLLQLLSVFISL